MANQALQDETTVALQPQLVSVTVSSVSQPGEVHHLSPATHTSYLY